MAIYHLSAKTVSRGSASAKARHDYIEREGRYQADHEEVTHSQSGNMPEWAKENPRDYWDSADVYERGNGRLFKQLEFALPKELNTEQQKELVQAFVDKITSTKDGPLPYSYAVHKGHDKENPHCHLMISERANDGHSRTAETWFKRANSKASEKGGAKKTEELKPKEWLQEARKEWSRQANRALARAGHQARIDHRSLEAQGVNREPKQHLGPAAAAMERKGIRTDRGRQASQDEPAQENQAEQELALAKAQRDAINSGINEAKERFQAEKERRQKEAERQREIELQKNQALERQRETQKEKEKKAALERLQEQRQKSRGMGFSR